MTTPNEVTDTEVKAACALFEFTLHEDRMRKALEQFVQSRSATSDTAIAQPVVTHITWNADGVRTVNGVPDFVALPAPEVYVPDTMDFACVALPVQPGAWREINTMNLSDELVWLRKENAVDGPMQADTNDYDQYTHWAPVESPPINIALPVKPALQIPAGMCLMPIEPIPEVIAAMAIVQASGEINEVATVGMAGAVEAYEAAIAAQIKAKDAP